MKKIIAGLLILICVFTCASNALFVNAAHVISDTRSVRKDGNWTKGYFIFTSTASINMQTKDTYVTDRSFKSYARKGESFRKKTYWTSPGNNPGELCSEVQCYEYLLGIQFAQLRTAVYHIP